MHHAAPHTGHLVASIDPWRRYDIVFTTRRNDWELSLRPFSLHTDADILYQWVKTTYSWPDQSAIPGKEYIQALAIVAESDFAQAFMVLEKGEPVSHVEVTMASQDEIALYIPCQPGDYRVSFPLHKSYPPDFQSAIVETCVAYFLTFPEVKRIMVLGEKTEDKWLTAAGFRMIEEGNEKTSVYLLSK